MIGLVSRLASTLSRKPVSDSCRSVCCRPGISRVLLPLVIDHSTIHTTMTPRTIAQRGMPPASSATGASWVGSVGLGRRGRGGHDCAASWGVLSSATTTRRIASSSTMPTSLPSSTTRTGCVGGERRLGRLAHDGARAHHRALDGVVGPWVAHHPLEGEHVGAGYVGGEVGDVLVGRGADDLVGRADLDHLAVAQDHDPVAELERLGEVVGDEHHRLADLVVQPDDLVLHVAADQRVEGRERLVEEQHRRVAGERAGQADALLHAAGELVGVAALEAGRARRGRPPRRPWRGAPSCPCRGPRGRRRRCRSPGGAAAARSAGTPSRPGCGAGRAAGTPRRR